MRLKKRNKRKEKLFFPAFLPAAFITLLFVILVGTSGCILQSEGLGIADGETVPPPDGCMGTYYSYNIHSAINLFNIRLPVTFEITGGDIPDGLTLDASTGILSGVPTTVADYTFEITAQNSSDVDPIGDYTIRIQNFSITTDYLPPACSGEACSAVIGICGGTGDFLYEIVDGPDFLDLGVAGETPLRHNTLTGTPPNDGDYDITVKVTDSTGEEDSKVFTLHVSDGVKITSPQNLSMAVEGESYEYTLQACGGSPPYTWSCSPERLPAGLTLSEAGMLWGVPNPGTAGTYKMWTFVYDSVEPETQDKGKFFILTVAGSQLTVSPITPPLLRECGEITASPIARASGGMGERHWEVYNLPTGMEGSARFTPAGDVLNMSWMPQIAGEYTFDVRVSDATTRVVETPVIFRVVEIPGFGIEIVRVFHMEGMIGDPDNEIYLDENNDGVVDSSDHRFKIRFRVTDGACATAVGSGDDIFSAGTTNLRIIGFCDLSIPADLFVYEPGERLYVAVFDTPNFNGMIESTGGIAGEYRVVRLRIEVDCSASNEVGDPIRYIGNTVDVRVFRERPLRP